MSSDIPVHVKAVAGRARALGQEIAKRREPRFTQQNFAKALGRKPGVVSAWETGKSLPELASLLGVCALLDTTPDELLAAAGIIAPSPSAPAMHSLLDCSILTAPERGMKDATFREAWKIVGQVWQRANPHRKKASPEDIEKWKALVITLRGFSPVGQTPEPAAEEPWPHTGHPLHR